MALSPPWNHIEDVLTSLQDFDLGAQRVSDFFKGKEESHAPDELLEIFFTGNPPHKIVERLLFFLFDIGVPDRQIGTRALQLRRLQRLWMRERRGCELTESELDLADATKAIFARETEAVEASVRTARDAFMKLMRAEPIEDTDRNLLVTLIRSEAQALRDRVAWLSENTDPYNMKTMARILPRLRIYDEAVHEGLDLARRQEAREPVGLRILSFEAHMKESGFLKWLGKIKKAPGLLRLAGLIERQREKKIPTLDLIALSSLCRWTFETADIKSGPLDWVERAMDSYQDGSFAVEVGEGSKILLPVMAGTGAKLVNGRVTGNFGVKSFPAWVGRDLLTKAYNKAVDEGALDMKAVVAQNITRDSVLEALLANPKIYQKPGLVGFIAATSRSTALLSKIAKQRELHSGFANRDVPIALLTSPCNIPVSLLRPLISVRFVSLLELRHIARAKAGIRREVKHEAEMYLKSRS